MTNQNKKKINVYKLFTGVYIVLSKVSSFGDDGEGGYAVEMTNGTVYDANEEDIKMIAVLLCD